MREKFRNPPRSPNGFSLVEVVLALGIVSFSLVGILSIFPVALDTAKDSKNETRITLIAQSIFSDLQSSSATNALVILKQGDNPGTSETTLLKLDVPDTLYIAYDADGKALAGISQNDFQQYTKTDASFLASINSVTNNVQPGMALVNVSIQSPPQARTGNASRKKYYFSAFLPNK